ncbi:hypothetical protein Glove_880g20 [Diversispora epigaea]|nr:hypothetical protein Glove_880g20 [Diversispora epigaea]
MLDDKSKTQRSMMDSLPTPATISTSISAFQGPPQHMIPQHSSGTSALPPPPNQSLSSIHPGGLDSMSPVGRNPSRTLTNSKRAAQNRAAQRAFRQRKDKYIKDLEAKAKDLDNTKKQLDAVLKERVEMSQTIKTLKAEISKLKGDDVSEDEGRQVFGNNNMNSGTGTSTSNYSHYGNSTRNDDDAQGLGDEPWLRHKDPSRKDCNNTNEERSNSFPFSPSSSSTSSSSSSSLNRPNILTETSSRGGGSGLVLPPGPNTDSSVDPYFRSDYRNNTNHHTSPTLSSSSPSTSERNRNSSSYPTSNNNNNNSIVNINNNNNNGRYSNNEEDTDRVYDDLCELLKTRTRPSLPQNIGNLWQPHPPSQQGVVSNGSSTVVG